MAAGHLHRLNLGSRRDLVCGPGDGASGGEQAFGRLIPHMTTLPPSHTGPISPRLHQAPLRH